MAKDKRKEPLEDVQKSIEKLIPQVTSNYGTAKTAEFLLRMLSKNGSRGMNLVISDKDFTKTFINHIEISDRIQEKLVSKMGDPDLVKNIEKFQNGIKEIEEKFETFVNDFLEKGIGHGRDLERYKKEKAAKEVEKTKEVEEKTKATTKVKASSTEEKKKTA